MAGLRQAIQSQLRAGGANVAADATATVTVSRRGQQAPARRHPGPALAHSLSFGAAGDASNALGMLGIANAIAHQRHEPDAHRPTNLGVARTAGSLDSAGLTGLTSTKTGV